MRGKPGAAASTKRALVEKTDEKGRPYVNLPRLSPLDAYYLYNPDNYFRYPGE